MAIKDVRHYFYTMLAQYVEEKQNLAGHQIYGQLEELEKQLKKKILPSGEDYVLLDRLLLLKLSRGN